MAVTLRKGLVTMKGSPVVLEGKGIDVGKTAPDFEVVDASFKKVLFSGFAGRPVLISSVPSLDTGVCALQTKRFNEESALIKGDSVLMTISMDLPFAQKRFCAAEKIGGIMVLSDFVMRSFGKAYGLIMQGTGLLARAVLIVDRKGKLAYSQIVPEIATEPGYDSALTVLRKVAGV